MNGRIYQLSYAEIAFLSVELEDMLGSNEPKMSDDKNLIEGLLSKLHNPAWLEEIAQRVEDIESGRVETVPSEETESTIRGDNG